MPLKQLISECYSADEITEAKNSLLSDMDTLKTSNFPKIIRKRRNSANRPKPLLDIDDIMASLTYLDEHQMWLKISQFTATSPDRMPSTRLVEGDLAIVWNKRSLMEEQITSIIKRN